MKRINQEAYLAYAKKFTDKERRLIAEFNEWLPEMIINCHAHCNLPEHVRFIDKRAYNHMLSTFPSFDLEESNAWQKLFHPGKKIQTLRFANVFQGIDHKAVNLYLLEKSNKQDKVALYGLPDDPSYTIKMLSHPRVSALKMYYMYLEPPATKIYQFFPTAILEEAQSRGIPIILHPPQQLVACLGQILEITKDFPRLRICLAHLALTKTIVAGLKEAFEAIAKIDSINLDTALVPSTGTITLALKTIGPEKIMYGSDEPLHLIRSALYIHPQLGERLTTEYPYHWTKPSEHKQYKHFAIGSPHAHWRSLCALKTAIATLPPKKQEAAKQKIFHDNAKSFYSF
jgi:hypothetical protein